MVDDNNSGIIWPPAGRTPLGEVVPDKDPDEAEL
jgi:hypothetical protein